MVPLVLMIPGEQVCVVYCLVHQLVLEGHCFKGQLGDLRGWRDDSRVFKVGVPADFRSPVRRGMNRDLSLRTVSLWKKHWRVRGYISVAKIDLIDGHDQIICVVLEWLLRIVFLVL